MKTAFVCLLVIAAALAYPEVPRERRSLLGVGIVNPAALAGNAPAGTISLPVIVPSPSGVIISGGAAAGPAHGPLIIG